MPSIEFAGRDGGTVTVAASRLDELAAGFRGHLIYDSDDRYAATRGLWNGMITKRPRLIAQCQGVADVVAVVNCAREEGMLLAVRAGGHNVAGLATCEGGIVIDLRLMRGARVDPSTGRVRIQGGASLGDLDRETQAYGLAVPAGVVSTTGIAGLTLGGGTGYQMRQRGLTIDNLVSADVVTASGEIVVASADENPDLFWGLRGGGGSFGVVTSFEYQAHPVGPLVTVADAYYPLSEAPLVLRTFRDFFADAPEQLGGALVFGAIPPIPYFPVEMHGTRVVHPAVVHVGPLDEGERMVQPMRDITTTVTDLSGAYPWTLLQSMFDSLMPHGDQYYWKSLYLDGLGDEVIEVLVEVMTAAPSIRTQAILSPMGGAVARVGADETAFGPRDMAWMLSLDSVWSDPAQAEENVAWTRAAWSALRPYSTGGLYLNFAGLGEEDDLVESALGTDNYERLVAIKDRFDPDNLFRTRLTVKPSVAI